MRGESVMNVVEIINVGKVYVPNKDIQVKALRSINLKISKGDFLSVIGPSGSGKSTLLHLLGGLEKQTEGSIIVNGRILDKLNEDELAEYRRTEVGFVFQKYNLIPILTAKENIELPATIEQEKVDESYFNQLIKLLNLEDRLNHFPGELSGGQQQRVSIARALIMKPGIILADEPTGNLDQKASNEIVKYLKLLSKTFDQTVIMITHSMDLAKQADRIVNIVDGKIED